MAPVKGGESRCEFRSLGQCEVYHAEGSMQADNQGDKGTTCFMRAQNRELKASHWEMTQNTQIQNHSYCNIKRA